MLQLCAALNIDKRSVDRDLAVYRNLLTKLVQAKELLKEYVERYVSYPFEVKFNYYVTYNIKFKIKMFNGDSLIVGFQF